MNRLKAIAFLVSNTDAEAEPEILATGRISHVRQAAKKAALKDLGEFHIELWEFRAGRVAFYKGDALARQKDADERRKAIAQRDAVRSEKANKARIASLKEEIERLSAPSAPKPGKEPAKKTAKTKE